MHSRGNDLAVPLVDPSGATDDDSSKEAPRRTSPSKHYRLASLDVVRGMTMAIMILVDEIGTAAREGWRERAERGEGRREGGRRNVPVHVGRWQRARRAVDRD